MPNMLQTGAAWLGEQLQAHAGRTVSIKQGVRRALTGVVATVSNVEYEIADASGFLTVVPGYDWTFVAADLGDLNIRTGDIVTETIAGVEQKYEVMPVGKKPCVEPGDSSSILLTVHTKKVA